MIRTVSTAIAIVTGIIVLTGYFFDIPIISQLNTMLVDWTVILAAGALFIGIINLISTHSKKIRTRQKGSIYSFILIISLLATLGLGIAFGPNHKSVHFIFSSIQLPVETSLMALLAITLIVASIRLLQRRSQVVSVIFLVTALLMLLGTASWPFGEITLFSGLIHPIIAQVPAAAGARGILLGVALGILTTGLRVLFGAERPYGGK